jgi:hypothetical protein
MLQMHTKLWLTENSRFCTAPSAEAAMMLTRVAGMLRAGTAMVEERNKPAYNITPSSDGTPASTEQA